MDPQSCKFCFWDTLCIVKVPVALVVPSEKKSSALPSTMFNHTAWWVFKNKFIHLLIWQKEIRKVFFLEQQHCRLSLLTTPTLIWRHKHSLNVYNTTAWLRMKCLNTPAHSCSERITEGGRAAHHAPAHPSSPSCAGSCQRQETPGVSGGRRAGRQLCPRTYLAQPHLSTTWGTLPGPLCRSCSPGERSKSQGAESTRGHLLQHNVTKDTSPPLRGESLKVLLQLKKC